MRLLPIIILSLTAAPVLAQEVAPAPASPPPAKPRKLCRTMQSTGSMMQSHVCHTAAEWKQIDDASEQSADNFRNRPGMRVGASQ